MEILVQQIDAWVSEQDIYDRVAEALHTPPVRLPGQGLTNFKLLLPKTGRNRHKGHAFVTIAETSTASAFFQYYSGRTGRPISIIRDGKYNALKLTPNSVGAEHICQDILRHSFETWDERQRRLRGEPAPSDQDDDVQHYAFAALAIRPTLRIPSRTVDSNVEHPHAWSRIVLGRAGQSSRHRATEPGMLSNLVSFAKMALSP